MTEPLNPEVAILNGALELPAAERAAFLDKACGRNLALLRQVESLLRAHDRADDFLEPPPGGSLRMPPTEKPGDKIGHYKLLQQVGEGGCGIVYMAEQEAPVRRRVALKIIKLGMDTKQVIARFEAERQALALMDHPNIAKVLDAGCTETGRPFFVMELVRGIRITDYCDQNSLSTQDRLDLFVQICRAIQHAHQKGIIHRDIKPSNILVTVHDGVAVPKVIDFGIAKATQGRLTDETLFTAFEQFIGTPAYMSPEQAIMTSVDIDTRSDIYSLGVLLYELLTGRTPFNQKELLVAGLDEMRRKIREEEPPRPSTCLSALHQQELTNAATCRRTEAPKLLHLLRGDLDWIVMKCLEKDRARRYETTNGLATDIQRHLDHEPVRARPPSNLYRLQKAVRRNKTMFAAATVVAVVLVIGVIVSTSQAIRARRAEREQIRLGSQAQSANRDLRDTVSLLELQGAENIFRNGDAGAGVAHLAALLRRDPSNHIAANRLVSALVHRNWALRTSPSMHHTGRIETISFSPDGKHVLSASRDHTARIWDAGTGDPIAVLGHAGPVECAHFNSSGTRIVTASADGTAQIWDARTGEPRAPPLQHNGKVYWAEFSPDERWVVTASADRTARIWDAATGGLKHELRKHTSHVVLARFSPDSTRIATGGSHASVRVWSVDSGEMLFRLEDREQPLSVLDFSPDGRRLVCGCRDGTVRLWNLETRSATDLRLQGEEPVDHAAFSPDSRFLLTGSRDTTARLWDSETGFPVGASLMHDGGVVAGKFSFDGSKIVTLSREHSVRLWDAHTRRLLCQPIRELEESSDVAFSPDGERLATAGYDGTIHIWNLQPRQCSGLETRFETAITSVAFSSDGESLLATSWDGAARVSDARTNMTLSFLPHQPGLYLAEFSPDGNLMFTASADGKVRLWDWRKGVVVAGPFQHPAKISFVSFNPTGDRVLTATTGGVAQVWDATTWRSITTPVKHEGVVLMSRFSPDGRLAVSTSEDHTARVWDAATGQLVLPPLSHANHVKWADFSPDGRKLVTASTDDTACVWDLQTGRLVTPPLRHARIVETAVFSPDSARIITSSLDRTARIWDVRTGDALTPPLKHDYSLVAACFARNGELAMTGCWKGAVRVWDARTGQPLTESLNTPGWISRLISFDPTGRRIATGGKDSTLRVWQIPSAPTPVPEWFLTFAETVAGIRLDIRGHLEIASPTEFEEAVRELKAKEKAGFYERLAVWFLADPRDREAPPF